MSVDELSEVMLAGSSWDVFCHIPYGTDQYTSFQPGLHGPAPHPRRHLEEQTGPQEHQPQMPWWESAFRGSWWGSPRRTIVRYGWVLADEIGSNNRPTEISQLVVDETELGLFSPFILDFPRSAT